MMKKKWIAAGIAAAIIAVVLGASWWLSRGEGTTGAKEIEIIVVDRSGALKAEGAGDKIVLVIDHCKQFGYSFHGDVPPFLDYFHHSMILCSRQ